MSGGNDGSGKGPTKPTPDAGGQKKPAPIIDLKATEVKPPEAKPAAAAQPASASAAKPGDKPADKPADKPTTATASAKPAEKPTDKPAPAKATPASPAAAAGARPASGGRGIVSLASHLFAGIAGGFLALLGADTIAPQLGLPVTATSTTELQKRLAALEEASKAKPVVAPEVAQKLAAAESRIAKVEETGRNLPQLTEAQAKIAAETKALAERLAKPAPGADAEKLALLEQRLAALSAAADSDPQKGRIPQLAQITGKLADLESALASQMTNVRKTVTQDVESRLGQATEAAEQARAGVQRIDRDLGAVKTQSAQAAQRLESLDQSLRATRDEAAALKSTVEGLKTDVSTQLKTVARPQDVSTALAPLNSKLAAVEQNLAGVVKGEDDRKANAERIVLSLELANLKRALDRGGSFAAELAAVQKTSGGKLDLKALDAVKTTGVPTTATLANEFRTAAYAIIAADSDQGEGSVVDKLMTSARSIVRVRKSTADANDTSAEAIAARMDTALKAGRLDEVMAEAKKLSPKARSAATAWLSKAEARATVDKAVADVEGQLKSALANKS